MQKNYFKKAFTLKKVLLLKGINLYKMINKKKKEIFLFIYPTYRCLGNCLFCYINRESRITREELTLEEAKKNIYYFGKKYLIDGIVVMGGETFLWDEIIPFIDFVVSDYSSNYKLNSFIITTEALKFSSIKFIDVLEKIFISNKFYPSFQVPLNTYCISNKIVRQRKRAILNLSKRGFHVRYILFFTKNNFSAIKHEALFLANIFSDYYKAHPNNFSIELRLPFSHESGVFIPQYKQFIESFSYICKIFFAKKISLSLRNIPLCYLEKGDLKFILDYGFKETIKREAMAIDKKNQLNSARIKSYNTSHCELFSECNSCILKNQCNGIHPSYIDKLYYPKLNPFIK